MQGAELLTHEAAQVFLLHAIDCHNQRKEGVKVTHKHRSNGKVKRQCTRSNDKVKLGEYRAVGKQ